ncbi:MAG: DUF3592 domain-containing protein [Dehalococcoidia bacterium]
MRIRDTEIWWLGVGGLISGGLVAIVTVWWLQGFSFILVLWLVVVLIFAGLLALAGQGPQLFLLTFAVMTLGLLFTSAYWYEHSRQFVNSSVRTVGTVVHVAEDSHIGGWSYTFIIKFPTREGRIVQFKDSGEHEVRRASYLERVGDKVEILYNPMNPSDAKIKSFYWLWLGPVIFLSVGSLLTTMFAAMIVVPWWSDRTGRDK